LTAMAPPSRRVESLLSLDGRCVLVSGASSGLGAHLARVLHEAGADVVLCARRVDKLRDLAGELNRRRGSGAEGGGAHAVEMDVADAAQVRQGFDQAETLLGRTCDVLLNCSGINPAKKVLELSDEEYDGAMAVNQRGAFLVAREAAARMARAGVKGSIINVASIYGLRQGNLQTVYAMSKAAMIQMTKNMALELARQGVRVNAIAPGYFPTEMNKDTFETEGGKRLLSRVPFRRLGALHELDAATLLLASESASSFVTGACLPVEGGHLVSAL